MWYMNMSMNKRKKRDQLDESECLKQHDQKSPEINLLLTNHYLRLLQVGTVIWIGILVYTDPAGIRTYLAAQVSEQSPLGDPGGGGLPPHLGVAPVFRGGDPTSTLSIHSAPDPTPLPENQSQGHHGSARAGPLPQAPPAVPQITWGAEDEEGWRRLSFRHWPSLFSYYNITLAKRWARQERYSELSHTRRKVRFVFY